MAGRTEACGSAVGCERRSQSRVILLMVGTRTKAMVGTRIAVNSSVRRGSGRAINPSGLQTARRTVIVGYTATQVTIADL